jgi:hypothetical protein
MAPPPIRCGAARPATTVAGSRVFISTSRGRCLDAQRPARLTGEPGPVSARYQRCWRISDPRPTLYRQPATADAPQRLLVAPTHPVFHINALRGAVRRRYPPCDAHAPRCDLDSTMRNQPDACIVGSAIEAGQRASRRRPSWGGSVDGVERGAGSGGQEMSSIFQISPPKVTMYAVFLMISSEVGWFSPPAITVNVPSPLTRSS